MYKILNQKLFKQLLYYFIICLLIGFAFQIRISVNQMLSFYPLEKIEHYFGYIILCSRLVMTISIVILLYQDFMDLYGAKYTFIQIRKSDNKRYFNYIILKEVISLLLFSFIYLISSFITMPLIDYINFSIFLPHYFSFILWVWNLFLISIFLTTFFKEQSFYYLLLGIFFIYMLLFSRDQFFSLLSYLNFNKSWLLGQMILSFLLINRIYHYQQIRR